MQIYTVAQKALQHKSNILFKKMLLSESLYGGSGTSATFGTLKGLRF